MKRTAKAEITVFLSLVFLMLLALVGAVIESASIQVRKNEKRADAGRAAESVFAEYQIDLMDRYGIFALEGSYESGIMSEENVLNRLSFYGAENMEIKIASIRYLTDDLGKEFYRQAVEYQKAKTGISVVEQILEKESVWQEKEKVSETYAKEDEKTNTEFEQLFQDSEEKLEQKEDPLRLLGLMKTTLFLRLLLPEEFELSEKEVQSEELASERSLRMGYGTLYEKEMEKGDAVLFNLYLLENFGHAGSVRENTCMNYELEYLIGGEESDARNLEMVLKKICGVRFAVNYAYLLTDQEKQVEAETLAGTLCMLLTIPGVIPVVKQGLLLAWAYGEGMMDTRALIEGESVPFIKTKENWKLSLEKLMRLEQEGLPKTTKEEGEKRSFDYQTYLQMLLLARDREELSMRALNLVEKNINMQDGKDFFQVDQCITGARFQVTCPMRRGVKYEFQVTYQYK